MQRCSRFCSRFFSSTPKEGGGGSSTSTKNSNDIYLPMHPQRMGLIGMSAFSYVTLALINGGLAEGKGRNKVGWSLASLFLGPFATAYIVFTNSKLA